MEEELQSGSLTAHSISFLAWLPELLKQGGWNYISQTPLQLGFHLWAVSPQAYITCVKSVSAYGLQALHDVLATSGVVQSIMLL